MYKQNLKTDLALIEDEKFVIEKFDWRERKMDKQMEW